MKEKIVAPCGIDCFNCEMYEENITSEFQERLAATTGIPAANITCKGCKDGNICAFLDFRGVKCSTLECVKSKNVAYCCDCDEFPCAYLMPIADGAAKYPHNFKVFNLCTIKRVGLEKFREQASDIRKTYFSQKMAIGEGGQKRSLE